MNEFETLVLFTVTHRQTDSRSLTGDLEDAVFPVILFKRVYYHQPSEPSDAPSDSPA